MRGKPDGISKYGDYGRITPADAGKTTICGYRRLPAPDHPRGCGENGWTRLLLAWNRGSPPRMRGKPDDRTVIIGTNGITPADAGKTTSASANVNIALDHPRGCGEN